MKKDMISIIIPTYNEVDNIKVLIPKIHEQLTGEGFHIEIIIVDDESPDGTAEAAGYISVKYPVHVHVRNNKKRGLSISVIEGFELAEGDIIVIMDADLSHPVEKIPEMVRPIMRDECDATVGSRNIPGGGYSTLPLSRKIISRIAGFMAMGVTDLSDPTSGFMAIRKSVLDDVEIDPLGWKIVLEIAAKARPRIKEIPILFSERKKGKSKLGLKAQRDYINHLWRLYSFKYSKAVKFIKFCLVVLSGIVIDTAVLICLVEFVFFDPRIAAVFAFIAAVIWNYIFNRVWTFDHTAGTKIANIYNTYVIVCIIGLGIRIGVMHILIRYANMGESPWYILASLLGIAMAAIVNFLGSRYLFFPKILCKKNGSKL
jgi:dolichol-phosphate mannosyltransferase